MHKCNLQCTTLLYRTNTVFGNFFLLKITPLDDISPTLLEPTFTDYVNYA